MIARTPSGYSEVLSFEIPKFSLSSCPSCAHKLSKLSIFPSYGLGCYAAPVCSFLMDRSGTAPGYRRSKAIPERSV
jgi:prepilin signal peptidase PulO-like enzyme (type II secretory pathway)